MTRTLAQEDVQRLLADPSAEMRVETAAKVAHQLDRDSLTIGERRIAEAIVRAMAHDAIERVRQAVAEHLKESRHLPRDVALALARDAQAVALPILQHATVLDDEDLIRVVDGADTPRLTAIARRAKISERLSRALVATDDRAAIVALIKNDGADLNEVTFETVMQRHGGDPDIDASMARRPRLPIAILERLVSAASEQLLGVLLERNDLPERIAGDLVLQIRERATVDLLSPFSRDSAAAELVEHLAASRRLTPSIILRALCLGDLLFVESAFSLLARIPLHNARLLIHDRGKLGFKSLYDHSGLPKALYGAFRVALDVARDTPFDGGEGDQERHRRRMIERILTQFEDVGAENLEYLMERLSRTAA